VALDLRNSKDESDAKIVFLPDSESGQLEYSTHTAQDAKVSKHGNLEKGVFENNLDTTSLSNSDESFPQHSYNGNVQVHNYSALLHDANLNAIRTFFFYMLFLLFRLPVAL